MLGVIVLSDFVVSIAQRQFYDIRNGAGVFAVLNESQSEFLPGLVALRVEVGYHDVQRVADRLGMEGAVRRGNCFPGGVMLGWSDLIHASPLSDDAPD